MIRHSNLPLTAEELAAKPAWATHYCKSERDFVLFESVEQWQWFFYGELDGVYPQEYGMFAHSILIEGDASDTAKPTK